MGHCSRFLGIQSLPHGIFVAGGVDCPCVLTYEFRHVVDSILA